MLQTGVKSGLRLKSYDQNNFPKISNIKADTARATKHGPCYPIPYKSQGAGTGARAALHGPCQEVWDQPLFWLMANTARAALHGPCWAVAEFFQKRDFPIFTTNLDPNLQSIINSKHTTQVEHTTGFILDSNREISISDTRFYRNPNF